MGVGFFDRVAIGMGAVLPTVILTSSARMLGHFSEKCNMNEFFYKYFVDNLKGTNGENITDKVIKAICPYKTLAHSANTSYGMRTATMAKAGALSIFTGGCVVEDLLFRGIIQELLLRKVPALILKKIKPGSETLVDCPTAKIARALLSTAICYGVSRRYMQPITRRALEASSCSESYRVSFLMDTLVSSVLKETPLGFLGSMAHHLSYAALRMPNVLFDC